MSSYLTIRLLGEFTDENEIVSGHCFGFDGSS